MPIPQHLHASVGRLRAVADKVTLVLSLGELFTARAAMEQWQQKLYEYEKHELTDVQQKEVSKFKTETTNILMAIRAAQARYLQGHAAEPAKEE